MLLDTICYCACVVRQIQTALLALKLHSPRQKDLQRKSRSLRAKHKSTDIEDPPPAGSALAWMLLTGTVIVPHSPGGWISDGCIVPSVNLVGGEGLGRSWG